MTYQFWMGTEASLHELQQLEAEAAELRKTAMASGEKLAFFFDFDDDEGDDRRIGAHLVENHDDAAVLKVSGSLVNAHAGWHRWMPGKVTSYEALIDAVNIIAEDDSAKRVVLKVGSGGGMVTGLDRVAQRLRQLDAIKPVTAHIDTMAMSGGYWLASAAREVVAGGRMAEVGSIGTLLVHMSKARMADEMGIDVTIFRAGEYKAMGHPLETLTDEAKAYLQADVDKTNTFFLEHVSKRRNLMMSNKSIWAEGKTFYAEEGIAAGLIDRVASLDEVIYRAPGAANHQRSYGMKISAEKLAQIEAGARPEDVLTADELKHYQASLETDPPTDPPADPAEGEEAGKGAKAEGAPPAEGDDPEQRVVDVKAHDQLLRDIGRLEAKLEAKEERITELEEKLTSREATFNSLMSLGVEAVNKRQMALGKPQTTPATAEALVTTFHDLSTEFAARFPVGQQSKAPSTDDDAENVTLIPRTLQLRKKGA